MSAAIALRASHQPEPGRWLSGLFALLVHACFVAVLFFGFDWKTQPPEGAVVDLWLDLPQPVEQRTAPIEPSKPEPVKPSPPVKEKSVPAEPQIATPSPHKKPTIPIKKEPEKTKPVDEPKKELPAHKEENKEKEKREAEVERVKQEQAEQQRKEEEAKAERVRHEQAVQQKQAQEAKAQQTAAQARIMSEVGKYKAMILAKIKSRIIMPPDLPGNPVVEYRVTLLPGGDVLTVSLQKSSGYPAFDIAVERAVFLSKPLPLPPDPRLFDQFRNLSITVHYLE